MKFCGIVWSPDFKVKSEKQFTQAQKFIDSEVLRQCDPYVPFRSGMLKKSGTMGTVIGSGIVRYIVPYAKKQYYENAGRGIEGLHASGGTRGLRGRLWFERMKLDHKDEILKKAKENFK